MKKISFLCICIMIFCNYTFAQIMDRMSFSKSELSFSIVNGYNKIELPDCYFINEIGSPALPYITVNYVIPFDKKITSISITDSASIIIPGSFNIYPAQDKKFTNETIPDFVLPNQAIYNSNLKYPSVLIDIKNQYFYKGFHILTLNIYPVSYLPSSKSLKLYTLLSFTINYETDQNIPSQPIRQSEFMSQIIKRQIISSVRNVSFIDDIEGVPLRTISSSGQTGNFFTPYNIRYGFGNISPEYIIITNDTDISGKAIDKYNGKSMTQIFQQLADWKTKKGIPTHVITVDEIKLTSTGCDLEEKIRNYLKNIYNQYGTIYILFGGSINVIPSRMIIMSYPSDLYYTAVKNNWNYNGNDIFGEYDDDKIEYNSEFYFSRALIDNAKEANIFINKVINYETLSENPDLNYVTNNLFLTGYLFGPPSNWSTEEIDSVKSVARSIINDNKWCILDDHIKFGGDQEFNLNNVVNNLNNGQNFGKFHLIYHLDHSNYSMLGTSSKFKNQKLLRSDVDKLTNKNYWQVLFTNGCSPGDFTKDCIIKHYLNNPNGGGVAAFASSASSRPDEILYFKNIIKFLGKTGNPPTDYNISVLHSQSMFNKIYEDDICKNHLFGDPEMPIWAKQPKKFNNNITFSTASLSNVNNTLTITINNIDSPFVKVCLFKEEEIYEVKTEYNNTFPYSKTFTFRINPKTIGNLTVTVTANNYIPYTTDIPIRITGKNIYISGYAIIDNNNMILDAGETANIYLSLTNNGTVNLTGISGKISCDNPNVIIRTPSSSFGNINIGQYSTKENFQIIVNENIPENYTITFSLEITDNSGYKTTGRFFFKVNSPHLEHIKNTYFQSSNEYTLFPEVLNNGNGDAFNVTATLSCTSTDVMISIPQIQYDIIKTGESNNSKQGFKFSASSFINKKFIITYSDKYNKNWSTNFFTISKPSQSFTNVKFNSGETHITLKWDSIKMDNKGYNVYRSNSKNGPFLKINKAPLNSASLYTDSNLLPKSTYYYYLTYIDKNYNESDPSQIVQCWTMFLNYHDGWPVVGGQLGLRLSGAPNTKDIDNDGKKELFFTASSWTDNTIMDIFAFNHKGEELYDIDSNPTTVSGFAVDNTNTFSTPALGDIDNDGITELIINAGDADKVGALYVYKIINMPNKPPLMYQSDFGESLSGNIVIAPFKGNNKYLQVLTTSCYKGANQEEYIHDIQKHTSGGQCYNSCIKINPANIAQHGLKSGMHSASDVDNDGYIEIALGSSEGIHFFRKDNITGNYKMLWTYTNKNYPYTTSPVIFADINNDGIKDIVCLLFNTNKAVVCVLQIDNTFVPGWEPDNTNHIIDLSLTGSSGDILYTATPYLSVGNIDGNNGLEIVIGGNNKLYVWKSDGNFLNGFPITINDFNMRGRASILADIDGEGDIDIICASGISENPDSQRLYAFHANGTAIKGFPILIDNASTPCVDDIDNDGKNELIARGSSIFAVWDTEGDANKIEWGKIRFDEKNSGSYSCECISDLNNPMIVTGTMNINFDLKMSSDIIVKPGANLTITSRIEFSDKSGIIVERGGQLTVNGGTLTNKCLGKFWKGIEVYGNYNQTQSTANCGTVRLLNGATIENAKVGIMTAKRKTGTSLNQFDNTSSDYQEITRTVPGSVILNYSIDTLYSGGKITAQNSTFKNNQRAVMFGPYNKTNYSSFYNCNFIIDKNIPADKKMVEISGTSGISFSGCNFKIDNNSTANINKIIGIYSYNGVFSVYPRCIHQENNQAIPHIASYCTTPPADYRSQFENLEYGIYATGMSGTKPFNVRFCNFIKNVRGIYFNGINNIVITDCSFDIIKYPASTNQSNLLIDEQEAGYGIYCNGSTGYKIEDNTLTAVLPSGNNLSGYKSNTYGIIINSSGGNSNRIYRNTFTDLEIALQAQDENRNPTTGEGLCFVCNNFNTNKMDITILASNNLAKNNIAEYQYNKNNRPAANNFTKDTYYNHVSDIYSYGTGYSTIYSTFANNYEDKKYIPTQKSSRIYVSKNNNIQYSNWNTECPKSSYNDVAVLNSSNMELLSNLSNEVIISKQALNNQMDGGNSQSLINTIEQADINDTQTLNTLLQNNSEYISDEAVQSVVKNENAVNNKMLTDVVAINSHSARNENIRELISERENPLSENMWNQIESSAENFSRLDLLKNNIQQNSTNYNETLNTISSTALENGNIEIWENLMETTINDELKYGYAVYNILKDDKSKSDETLNSLNNQNIEYNEFIKILNNQTQTGKFNTTDLNRLTEMSSENNKVGILAAGLLSGLGYIDYKEPIFTIQENNFKNTKSEIRPTNISSDNTILKTYPNPASKNITIEYEIKNHDTPLTARIIDSKGIVKKEIKLEKFADTFSINLTDWPKGVYIIHIYSENNQICENKFIIK